MALLTIFGAHGMFVQPRLDERWFDHHHIEAGTKQSEFQAHRIAQSLDGKLTGGVNAIAWHRKFAQDAADINHPSPAVRAHQWQCCTYHRDWPNYVRLKLL